MAVLDYRESTGYSSNVGYFGFWMHYGQAERSLWASQMIFKVAAGSGVTWSLEVDGVQVMSGVAVINGEVTFKLEKPVKVVGGMALVASSNSSANRVYRSAEALSTEDGLHFVGAVTARVQESAYILTPAFYLEYLFLPEPALSVVPAIEGERTISVAYTANGLLDGWVAQPWIPYSETLMSDWLVADAGYEKPVPDVVEVARPKSGQGWPVLAPVASELRQSSLSVVDYFDRPALGPAYSVINSLNTGSGASAAVTSKGLTFSGYAPMARRAFQGRDGVLSAGLTTLGTAALFFRIADRNNWLQWLPSDGSAGRFRARVNGVSHDTVLPRVNSATLLSVVMYGGVYELRANGELVATFESPYFTESTTHGMGDAGSTASASFNFVSWAAAAE